jgi:vitamin B12 transporter
MFEAPPTEIIVTASRTPEEQSDSAASVTIIDAKRIERLGEPQIAPLLRLIPSVAVATSGPAGSLTEVRIRGAEANHTLLFIDGIRANDPAAGNTPRFELLNADLVSRIEVVRGPQSALWGSEAIGGVVAVDGPADAAKGIGGSAMAEAGSFGFVRTAAAIDAASDDLSVAAGFGWQRATGIDSFDGSGDRDGYRNLAARLRAAWTPRPALTLGASGFALNGRSEFDGFDPATFVHADTLDSSRNKLAAGRLWAMIGEAKAPWSGSIAGSLLGSSNRNLLDGDPVNRTRASRATLSGQLEHRLTTGTIEHLLVGAVELEREKFHARDAAFGGFSAQDRSRRHDAITLEYRANFANRLVTDVALRRDRFDRFKDATTLRASALARVGSGIDLALAYSEGIAQPTFFDLYGFFPGSFVGNPSLKPESSRGFELSARIRRETWGGRLAYFRQRLRDEIVDVFDSTTFLSSTINTSSKSRRSGIEAEADWSPNDSVRVTAHYALLNAKQGNVASASLAREVRRPKHSGSIAVDGQKNRLSYGASIAYSGERFDTDFDQFPAARVRLDPYWQAGARVAYRVHRGIELFGRIANAFDADTTEVVGYRTEGRSAYGGVRVAFGR